VPAAAGATVATRAADLSTSSRCRAALRGARRVSAVETNVRESEAVARMVERVMAEHGRIDILRTMRRATSRPSASLSPNAWRGGRTDLYGSSTARRPSTR
jgi:NAD(P)-dependent dehydrogenase (short-subunit alcohol dehydrogenase family)